MPIKGASYLVSGQYEDIGDRFFADIDLLLPAGSALPAREAMRKVGYFDASETGVEEGDHHHLVPLIREECPAAVELHLAPVPSHAQPALPAATIWSNAAGACVEGAYDTRPSANDEAMRTFLHADIVDRNLTLFFVPLRLFHDMHLLVSRHGKHIDWRRNDSLSQAIDSSARLRRYLYVLYRLSGARGPDVPSPSWLDAAHFAMCRAAVATPLISRCVLRVDRLTGRTLRERYAIAGGMGAVNRYRMRELGGMLRKALRINVHP